MNRDRFEGVWKQITGRVKETWCGLTGDAPGVAAGKSDQCAGSMQERRGISTETSERQLEEFLLRNRNWMTRPAPRISQRVRAIRRQSAA